jgi:hypothetical protein
MIFTIVDFSDGGDGIHALYYDGQLVMAGDYYHDKINESIDAFIEGFKLAVENEADRSPRTYTKSVHYENHDNEIYDAPLTLNQLKKTIKETEGTTYV